MFKKYYFQEFNAFHKHFVFSETQYFLKISRSCPSCLTVLPHGNADVVNENPERRFTSKDTDNRTRKLYFSYVLNIPIRICVVCLCQISICVWHRCTHLDLENHVLFNMSVWITIFSVINLISLFLCPTNQILHEIQDRPEWDFTGTMRGPHQK